MKQWFLITLFGLLALSGCLDNDSNGDTTPNGEATGNGYPGGAFLAQLGRVSDAEGGGEPSLGVTPDGVWYTNIFSNVYRSTDDGATWENLGDPNPGIPNNDPDLAVDMDGVIWESRLYALVCNAVSVSQDGGDSWTNSQAVCNLPVGDRQYVVPTRDCEAFLYWHQVPTFYQTVMRTTDCGNTWLPTGPAELPDGHLLVTEGSSWGGGGFYNQVTDSTFITYTRSPGIVATTQEAPGFSVTR
ncbi:MAG: sialidase family protein, partial [Thermoplasmatota archaeon]